MEEASATQLVRPVRPASSFPTPRAPSTVPRPLPAATAAGRLGPLRRLWWCDRPTVTIASLDRVVAHQPDAVEERFAVPRGVVQQDRPVGRHRVVERLAEVPLLRFDREKIVLLGKRCFAATSGIWVGVGLPMVSVKRPMMLWNDVVVREAAVEPGRVRCPGADGRTGLSFRQEAARSSPAPSGVDAIDDHRVAEVVERIAERRGRTGTRRPGPSAGDCSMTWGKPFPVHEAVQVLRLRLGVGVEVAIVVVADVFLVKPRQVRASDRFSWGPSPACTSRQRGRVRRDWHGRTG